MHLANFVIELHAVLTLLLVQSCIQYWGAIVQAFDEYILAIRNRSHTLICEWGSKTSHISMWDPTTEQINETQMIAMLSNLLKVCLRHLCKGWALPNNESSAVSRISLACCRFPASLAAVTTSRCACLVFLCFADAFGLPQILQGPNGSFLNNAEH